MAREIIDNGETGADVRAKLNDNFAELYAWDGSGSIQQPVKMLAGAIIGNGQGGGTLSTSAYTVDALRVAPISFPRDTPIDQLGLSVSTAVAAALFRAVIYDTDVDGRPTTLLVESPDIDASTTGTKLVNLLSTFTFIAGKTYWIGAHSNSTATLRALAASAAPVLTWSTAATPAATTTLARTATFGSPGNWPTFANNQANTSAPPLVLMRRA